MACFGFIKFRMAIILTYLIIKDIEAHLNNLKHTRTFSFYFPIIHWTPHLYFIVFGCWAHRDSLLNRRFQKRMSHNFTFILQRLPP